MRGVTLAVGSLILLLVSPRAPRVGMPATGATLTVEGILHVGEFFGPPNYGEHPKTDRLEHTFYLQLPAPVSYQTGVVTGETDLTSDFFMQLVVYESLQAKATSLIDRRVRVRGSLMEAVTGHHRTGHLLEVSSIAGITTWQW